MSDDAVGGLIGFSIWKKTEDGEDASNLSIRVAKKADTILFGSRALFDSMFDQAWRADFPIDRCDDPMTRQLGFIVTRRSSRTLYRIPLVAYQK